MNTLVMRSSLGGDEDQGAEVANRRARPQATCPLRARSAGQRRELTVTPGQPDTPAHLRYRQADPLRKPTCDETPCLPGHCVESSQVSSAGPTRATPL